MCHFDPQGYAISKMIEEVHYIARKYHRCSECAGDINVGESYLREKIVCDGGFLTFKTCTSCQYVRVYISAECGGFYYGELEDSLAEHASEHPTISIYRALVGMRNKWRHKSGHKIRMPVLHQYKAGVEAEN